MNKLLIVAVLFGLTSGAGQALARNEGISIADQDPGQNPGQDPGQDPGQGPGQDPGQGPGQE